MSGWIPERGFPYPFGTTLTDSGINFSLCSKNAAKVTLCLFSAEDGTPLQEYPIDPSYKTGDVWHLHIHGAQAPLGYGYRIDGPKEKWLSFDPSVVLLDPYAKALLSLEPWGGGSQPLWGVALPKIEFDWEGDRPLRCKREDLIIYEMYLRGFTQHPSSQVSHPGTFEGMIEKIPYLVTLGVTAVELLPIYAFDECTSYFKDPNTGLPLGNAWGYSPLSFFAPMPRYSIYEDYSTPLIAFKKLVKALHAAGIGVILDVVYNHTGEGGINSPPLTLKGIDFSSYYLFDGAGHLLDFTGCGNCLSANSSYTRELIVNSLRYWVSEMHIDGFRFDLASVLNRGRHGRPLATSPLVEALSQDPILADSVLIAEPWDAAGMYQVGAFYPQEDRWCEWNGKYRDSVRIFLNGVGSNHNEFATRLSGSQDLYGHFRRPTSSINFVTAHDGFTLNDLVSYSHKHNFANGENNRDGSNENYSWNCGAEGPSTDPGILALRRRQKKNFALALFISQGVPMMLMGDEYGHTKWGNNNSYCQDNELNWFLWERLDQETELWRFFQGMIKLRKRYKRLLQRPTFLTHADVLWFKSDGSAAEWDESSPFLSFMLYDPAEKKDLFIAFNAQNRAENVILPSLQGSRWHRLADTFLPSPDDLMEEAQAPTMGFIYPMGAHSSIVLVNLKPNPEAHIRP